MTWDNTENSSGLVTLTLKKNGERITKDYPSDTTIESALTQFTEENHIKRYDVEDSDSNTIDEDEGNETLGSVGALFITAVATGA